MRPRRAEECLHSGTPRIPERSHSMRHKLQWAFERKSKTDGSWTHLGLYENQCFVDEDRTEPKCWFFLPFLKCIRPKGLLEKFWLLKATRSVVNNHSFWCAVSVLYQIIKSSRVIHFMKNCEEKLEWLSIYHEQQWSHDSWKKRNLATLSPGK